MQDSDRAFAAVTPNNRDADKTDLVRLHSNVCCYALMTDIITVKAW
ncbi:MAG: hypothetical protein ACI84R_001903 [Candidatus Azotimanducaceae bacterium]|jgi:hypothetical protein